MGDIELQTFSERLKELRHRLNLTQKDLADKIGVTAAALSSYENNIKNPSIAVAKRIADAFNVSIDWLCGLTDKMNYNEEIETYADMFQLIIKLCETPHGDWSISYEDSEDISDSFYTFPNTSKLTSIDPYVAEFFKDWEQMYKLYKNNTIDQHLYNLWLSDKLKYYKKFSLNDELPFS